MRSPEEVHRSFPGGPVLVVGDSHTWMAGAGRQYPTWDTDCRAGRTTGEGLAVVAANLAPRHGVVVFDNATNDGHIPPERHWGELLELRELVGDRQLVLVSSWRLDISLEHVVSNQRRLAAEDPASTSMADWAEFVIERRRYFADDELHFIDEAMPIRTQIVEEAVRAAQLRAEGASARRLPKRG